MSHERYWGREERQVTRDLPNLTEPETRVYDALRDNRIRPNLRLEQERVRSGVVSRIVARLRVVGSGLCVDKCTRAGRPRIAPAQDSAMTSWRNGATAESIAG
jgi:hypothetical protein